MILFGLLAFLLMLLAGALLVLAMRRSVSEDMNGVQTNRARINVAIFREREAELAAELAAGRIGTEQHAALVTELESLLVGDVQGHEEQPVIPVASGRRRALLVWLTVPVLAVPLYLVTGFSPDVRAWLQLEGRAADVAALPQPLSSDALAAQGLSLADAARLTQATLLRRPADADAWFRLGITWAELDAPVLAVESLRTARRLAPARLDITLTLARVELALNRNQLNDEIRMLLDAVLAQEPQHQGVLMVYGMAAFDSGDFATAVQRWERLLAGIDPASEGAGLLRQSIARARANAGAVTQGAAIPLRIVLAAGLENPPPGATVFVVVRAADGPPMPVAAKKLAPRFPLEVTITDADQMMPGASLSARGPLELRARISVSGNPMPSAGDIESAPVRVTLPLDAPVTLTLERRIP